jgi:hypothetical protein
MSPESPDSDSESPSAARTRAQVAVEFISPIPDLNNPPPPPEGFTGSRDAWAINQEYSLWTLHVWVWKENPDGIFAPFNPKVP